MIDAISRVVVCFGVMFAMGLASTFAQEPPKKTLPLPGEVFATEGRTAFLIRSEREPAAGAKPWVWYAPTLPNLPGPEERWMFERFTAAGIAIAGIDAGESFGSPTGNSVFTSLYEEMTRRGYASKPVLLGRSRGGLMTLSWAAANPGKVAAFAGIYPVCDLASYPGVDKAAPAYDLKPSELAARLKEFTPIDRLAPLAKARVPLFAIHGDVDTVVPLEANSGLMKQRYEQLGGAMQLIVPAKQGHNMWPGFFECSELVKFVKVHSGVGLMIDSPLSHQVIQRNSRNEAEVRLHGVLGSEVATADSIECRVSIGHRVQDWRPVQAKLGDSEFEAFVTLPQGAGYVLLVRALRKGAVVANASIKHVHVGEVFVVAGQSNSANHGEEKQVTKSGRVTSFDGKTWRIANDPQLGASGEGGSFLPPLGDALAEKFDVPVGFVSCGVGATSVREWLPKGTQFRSPPTLEGNVEKLASGEWASKGELYDRFVTRMKQLGPNGFRAVLWHQGESDANQPDPARSLSQQEYREDLESLIRQSRKDLAWDAPWFVAQASYHTPGDEGSEAIRAAQASLWKDNIALEGPDSDAIKGAFREANGQGVHFSGKGLREHAAKWFEKLAPWLQQQLAK